MILQMMIQRVKFKKKFLEMINCLRNERKHRAEETERCFNQINEFERRGKARTGAKISPWCQPNWKRSARRDPHPPSPTTTPAGGEKRDDRCGRVWSDRGSDPCRDVALDSPCQTIPAPFQIINYFKNFVESKIFKFDQIYMTK